MPRPLLLIALVVIACGEPRQGARNGAGSYGRTAAQPTGKPAAPSEPQSPVSPADSARALKFLAADEIDLAGILRSDDTTAVLRKLGPTTSRGKYFWLTADPLCPQWDFSGVSVRFVCDAYEVQSVMLIGDRYATKRDIRVGSTAQDVEKAYGPPHETVRRTLVWYVTENFGLLIELKEGRVSSIAAGYVPAEGDPQP